VETVPRIILWLLDRVGVLKKLILKRGVEAVPRIIQGGSDISGTLSMLHHGNKI
jgi:hypothetical protein